MPNVAITAVVAEELELVRRIDRTLNQFGLTATTVPFPKIADFLVQ